MWNVNGWLCEKLGLTPISQSQKCVPETYKEDIESSTLGMTIKAGDATGMCAEPKSIDELKGYGLRVKAAQKGKDSIQNGIQWIQELEIIIHPRCVNFITEISNYTWDKDKFGNKLNIPIDDFNHLMDAMRYALEQFIKKKTKWVFK